MTDLPGKKLMTVAEAAAYLSVSTWFLRVEHKAHRIRFVDITHGAGKRPTFRVERVEADRWADALPTAIPKTS